MCRLTHQRILRSWKDILNSGPHKSSTRLGRKCKSSRYRRLHSPKDMESTVPHQPPSSSIRQRMSDSCLSRCMYHSYHHMQSTGYLGRRIPACRSGKTHCCPLRSTPTTGCTSQKIKTSTCPQHSRSRCMKAEFLTFLNSTQSILRRSLSPVDIARILPETSYSPRCIHRSHPHYYRRSSIGTSSNAERRRNNLSGIHEYWQRRPSTELRSRWS